MSGRAAIRSPVIYKPLILLNDSDVFTHKRGRMKVFVKYYGTLYNSQGEIYSQMELQTIRCNVKLLDAMRKNKVYRHGIFQYSLVEVVSESGSQSPHYERKAHSCFHPHSADKGRKGKGRGKGSGEARSRQRYK